MCVDVGSHLARQTTANYNPTQQTAAMKHKGIMTVRAGSTLNRTSVSKPKGNRDAVRVSVVYVQQSPFRQQADGRRYIRWFSALETRSKMRSKTEFLSNKGGTILKVNLVERGISICR